MRRRNAVRQNAHARFSIAMGFLLSLTCFASTSRADDFLSSGRFYKQLAAPITLVLDGKPFRDSVLQVAEQADLNIWIDRQIDPSENITAGQLGPNVFAAIERLAAQQDCVVLPVANVMLVGRPKWVDATGAALASVPKTAARTNFDWAFLSTPRDVYAQVTQTPVEQTLALPHDLWPAASLKNLSRPLVANLILAQFGRRLTLADPGDFKSTLPLSDSEKFDRRYSHDEVFQSAFKSVAPQINAKVAGSIATVSATAKVHRELVARMLSSIANQAPQKSIDERRFESLKIKSAKAGDILRQLAGVANLTCVFADGTDDAAATVMSLDAKDKTLRQLIELVADEVNLKVSWAEKTMTLTSGG